MLLAERLQTRRIALSLAEVTPSRAVFLASFLGYLVAAAVLVLGFHSIVGDAWSRVGNADYMLFSRDPHLAAIGFVWGPLPSLLTLPLLVFWRIWPDLVAVGFAGSIVSAACMAAAVWQVWASATDWGLAGRTRVAITAAFALHPMIVYYAANGMSEAIFLLTLIVAARYLARWLRDGDLAAVVVSGIALALGYLTRYEAIPAALGAAALVGVVGALRARGTRRRRALTGLADATVLLVPAAAAFIGFAFASLLIVGNPFEQFTSVYGIASQLAVVANDVRVQTGQGSAAGYVYIARQVVGLSPAVLVLVPLGLVAGRRRPNAAALAVLATLGLVVAWSVFGFLTGRTLGWLRYSIAVIPLDCLLAAALLGSRSGRLPAVVPALWVPSGFAFPWRTLGATARLVRRGASLVAHALPARLSPLVAPRRWAVGLIALLLVVSVPVGTLTMLDERNNPQEGGEGFFLRPIVHIGPTFGTVSPLAQYEVGREVAAYVDSLGLRDGQVLIDVSSGFPIVLQSADPRQFVITTDRDFQAALQSPQSFGVRYVLVPEDVGYAHLDALNRAYPGIYSDPAGIGSLVRTFSAGGNSWRLIDVGVAPAG
jgi:hypothetical protein